MTGSSLRFWFWWKQINIIRMIINHVEIMRFPPAQRGDVISYPSLFPLPVSSFWSHTFGSVLGIKYHFWRVLLLFLFGKATLRVFICAVLFFSTQKVLQLLCGAKNCAITGVMKVLYFVFVVSFPCNFFCYCGHSTRKGATKKCCQTNNTFEPKKIWQRNWSISTLSQNWRIK